MSWLAALLVLSQAGVLAEAALPDAALAEQRGGLRLPNGIDLAVTVQTQTAVNGDIVLQTSYRVDEGSPTLIIYAPPTGARVPLDQRTVTGLGASDTAGLPKISFDRMTGLSVTPAMARSPASLSTSSGSSVEGPPAGLVQVAPGSGTDAGDISESVGNGVRSVTLGAADLSITHLAGNAFGSAIVNSGNDRVIDTQTTISIDLRNFSPDVLGSAMFRVQDIALDAVALRTGG